jgi:hypothetical protein
VRDTPARKVTTVATGFVPAKESVMNHAPVNSAWLATGAMTGDAASHITIEANLIIMSLDS